MNKIKIEFLFKTMYNPGEDAPPQFQTEGGIIFTKQYIPILQEKLELKR